MRRNAIALSSRALGLRFVYIRVKQSRYRPWQALSVPAGWGCQILRHSAHEGGKAVSPTHRPPLPQEIFLVFISVRGWVDPRTIVRLEGFCEWWIPMTQSGIDPATFRFIAQCLSHCATACPVMYICIYLFIFNCSWVTPGSSSTVRRIQRTEHT
jgi:hypothetical protein